MCVMNVKTERIYGIPKPTLPYLTCLHSFGDIAYSYMVDRVRDFSLGQKIKKIIKIKIRSAHLLTLYRYFIGS